MADEDKKKEDAKEEVAKSADVNAALLDVLKALPTGIKTAVTEANAPVLKALDEVRKALPPKDATFPGGKSPKSADYDPTAEEVMNDPSPDAATKPASVQPKSNEATSVLSSAPTMQKAQLLTKADVEASLANLLEKALKEKVPELVKASTPEPLFGAPVYTDELRALAKAPGATIDAMLTKDRELAGGPYNNPEGFSFGWRKLDQGSHGQRLATEMRFKMLGGKLPSELTGMIGGR